MMKTERWFALFNERLAKSKFFLADEPTIVDFHGVFAFSFVEKAFITKGGYIEKYPNVVRWWAEVKEVPAVKEMVESGIAMLP